MSTGDVIMTRWLPFAPERLAWSPDGRRVVVGGNGKLAAFDARSGTLKWQHEDEWSIVRGIAVGPYRGRVAVLASKSSRRHRVRLLDVNGDTIWSRIESEETSGPSGSATGGTTATPGDVASAFFDAMAMGFAEAFGEAIAAGLRNLRDVVFSPDGGLLAVPGLGWLLDVRNGRLRFELPEGATGPSRGVLTPAFSSDSRWVAAGSPRHLVLLSASSGDQRWSTPIAGQVTRLAFDEHDRQLVAVCRRGQEDQVVTVDAANGDVRTSVGLDASISAAHFFIGRPPLYELSRDRRFLAVTGTSSWGVFRTVDGSRQFERHWSSVADGWSGLLDDLRVRLSPAGAAVAVNGVESDEGSTQVGKGVAVLRSQTGETVWADGSADVRDVAFNPDGTRLAVCGSAGAGTFVRVHRNGLEGPFRELARLAHGGRVRQVAVTTAGQRLVACAGSTAPTRLSLFQADSGDLRVEVPIDTSVTSIVFSPDGYHYATGSSDGGVRLYRTEPGGPVWTVRMAHHAGQVVNTVAFLPGGAGVVAVGDDKTARRLGYDAGEEVWRREHPQAVRHVAVCPDGRWVATATGGGGSDRSTRVLDAASGAELFRRPHDVAARSLVFGPTPGGGSVLAAATGTTVLLVDPVSGSELLNIGHPSAVAVAAISADGARLATGTAGSSDRTVRVYDLATLDLTTADQGGAHRVRLAEIFFDAPVKKLAFLPGTLDIAVVSDDTVTLLDGASIEDLDGAVISDVDAAESVHRFVHRDEVNDLAVSSDGELIVTACSDGLAYVRAGASS